MAVLIPTNGLSTTMVAEILGEGSNDVGTLCSSNRINMWAKYKPVRYNSNIPPTEYQRSILEHGLTAGNNNPGDLSFTVTSPYYLYNKPRGKNQTYNEPFRMGDFLNPGSTVEGTNKSLPGYNSSAECFIVDDTIEKRLTFNKIFELQSSVTGGTYGGRMDMTRILNNSSNVEIPIGSINSDITLESYVGVFFYNNATGAKFYNVYNVKWSQLGTLGLPSWIDFFPTNITSNIDEYGNSTWQENFYLTGEQIPIYNGDQVHAYYCCVPLQFYNSLGQPDQWRTNSQSETYWQDLFISEDVIYFITSGLNELQIVAPTPINGHGIINISKFDFMNNNHLSLYDNQAASNLITDELIVNISRNASGVVSCTSAKIPLSVYYYGLLSSYDTSLVTPIISIDFEVKADGVTLLREIVSRHIYSSLKEISSASNDVNLYITTTANAQLNTTNIPTNEPATIYFTMKAKGVNSTPIRTLVSGTCTISTGGIQTWYFDQV